MRSMSLFLLFILPFMTDAQTGFRNEQLKNNRVKEAYRKYENSLKEKLAAQGLKFREINILLVGLKLEKKLRVYIRKKSESRYRLFTEYDFCVLSGALGPKRKEGDLQVPEGLYYVNWFNPNSNFHLSFKINYPNSSDLILSDKKTPGGEIFIHGKCVSIGCIPLTDEGIEEMYILAVEAKENGQSKIPVYIFPCEMNANNLFLLQNLYAGNPELLSFWNNLSEAYTKYFSSFNELKFTVDKSGKYIFND